LDKRIGGKKSRKGQFMDVASIISELRLELGDIQEAILSLELFDWPSAGTPETSVQSRTELRTVTGAGGGS
jgi:hypothetical protein